MAALQFNQDTVRDLMSFIDDNKHQFNECQYIQFCNAIKFLHSNSSSIASLPEIRLRREHILNNIYYYQNMLYNYSRITNLDKYNVLISFLSLNEPQSEVISTISVSDLELFALFHTSPKELKFLYNNEKIKRVDNNHRWAQQKIDELNEQLQSIDQEEL